MASETILYCDIIFNRKTYNSRYEVEQDLEEVRSEIKHSLERIRDLVVMTEPKKFCEEDEDPLYYISNIFNEETELLRDNYIEEWKLEMLLENWNECHTDKGLALSPPDNLGTYLCGDYVYTDKYPNNQSILRDTYYDNDNYVGD